MKPWYFLNPCHFYSLTLSFVPFKSNSRIQTLLSLSYLNSLPSTIASSIFSLPQCSSPTYGTSSHSHYQASPVQRDQPFISSENHLYSFSSITVSLENPSHFLTHWFRHPTTQKGNFSILFVSFQYIFTSSFSFSTSFFCNYRWVFHLSQIKKNK